MKKINLKKISSLIAAIAIVLGMFTFTVSADAFGFSCSDKLSDNKLVVSVNIVNGAGFEFGDFTIEYDKSVLTFEKYTDGTDADKCAADRNNSYTQMLGTPEDGKISYSAFFSYELDPNGDFADKFYVFDLVFKVASGAEGKLAGTKIKFNGDCSVSGDNQTISYTYKVVAGASTPPEATTTPSAPETPTTPSTPSLKKGDIDGDDSVTAADARLVLRSSVGLESFNDAQKKAADTDSDGTISASDARTVLRISVGLSEDPSTPSKPSTPSTPSEPTTSTTPSTPENSFNLEDYKYFATNDFMGIKTRYEYVEAQGAYMVDYVDKNGDHCVLVYIRYKILSNYSEVVLHNLTKGTTIKDPKSYYEKMASRYYGANKIKYLEMSNDALGKTIVAQREMTSILANGTHSGVGVYVTPSYMDP